MTEIPESDKSTNIEIGLGAQYIKDFSFESPNVPQVFNALQEKPDMAMNVNVMSRGMGTGTFESVLNLKLEAKAGDKVAFIAELAYAGVFSLPDVPEEHAKMFLLVEAPRLLFPFARSIIANAVREGGFPNVVLQPVDFMALYAAQKDNVGTMTPSGVA